MICLKEQTPLEEWSVVSQAVMGEIVRLDPQPFVPKKLRRTLGDAFKNREPITLVAVDCIPCHFLVKSPLEISKTVFPIELAKYGIINLAGEVKSVLNQLEKFGIKGQLLIMLGDDDWRYAVGGFKENSPAFDIHCQNLESSLKELGLSAKVLRWTDFEPTVLSQISWQRDKLLAALTEVFMNEPPKGKTLPRWQLLFKEICASKTQSIIQHGQESGIRVNLDVAQKVAAALIGNWVCQGLFLRHAAQTTTLTNPIYLSTYPLRDEQEAEISLMMESSLKEGYHRLEPLPALHLGDNQGLSIDDKVKARKKVTLARRNCTFTCGDSQPGENPNYRRK